MGKVYGYVRVSTPKQNIDRQIRNIKAAYPAALIVQDEYTGTKMDRPNWTKLYRKLNDGRPPKRKPRNAEMPTVSP